DRLAAVKLAASSDLTGAWGDTRVLAIHGSRDELVFPEHLAEIAALQRPDARPPVTATVLETEPAHCGFSEREVTLALGALRAWIDEDAPPSAAALQAACALPDGSGDRCAYDATIVPGPLASRVRERAAPPDFASANHAGIWYDPAFSGEGWVIEVLP